MNPKIKQFYFRANKQKMTSTEQKLTTETKNMFSDIQELTKEVQRLKELQAESEAVEKFMMSVLWNGGEYDDLLKAHYRQGAVVNGDWVDEDEDETEDEEGENQTQKQKKDLFDWGDWPFACKICDRMFRASSDLTRHQCRPHYKCKYPSCKMYFLNEGSYLGGYIKHLEDSHDETAYNDAGEFICHFCPQTFDPDGEKFCHLVTIHTKSIHSNILFDIIV